MPARGAPRDGDWAAYLKDCRVAVESKYKGRNQGIKDVADRRFNRRKPRIPKNFEKTTAQFHAPFVRYLIRAAQAIISHKPPTPHVTPLKIGTEARENALLRQKWLIAAYKRMQRDVDVFGMITDAMAADKGACWKVTLKTHRWGAVQRAKDEGADEYNGRVSDNRRANFPFIWEHVATETYYPLAYDLDGLSEVLEITEREARPVADQYNLRPDGSGSWTLAGVGAPVQEGTSTYPKTCKFVEFWSRDRFCYAVDGVVVKTGKHGYGRPPYFWAPFSTTSVKDPTYESEGIADTVLHLQDTIENFVTIKENWAYLSGFPTATVTPISEDAIPTYDNTSVIEWEPGGTVQPPMGYKWGWVPLPPIGGDVNQLIELLMKIHDDVSLAPILYGKGAGDMSGPTATAMTALARSVFGPGLENLARAFNETAAHMQYVIEKVIKAPVPVYVQEGDTADWLELGPDDIKGYYAVEHQLDAVIPVEAAQQLILLEDANARGLVTKDHVRRNAKALEIADPERMAKEVLVEALETQPQFVNVLLQKFLEAIQALQKPPDAAAGGMPGAVGPDGQPLQPGVNAPSVAVPPVGPGGPGVPQLAGVQQPMQPGISPQMAAPPPTVNAPPPMPMPNGVR